MFLIGLPASGKSTIGKILASEYNFCYLDKDIVCNKFTGLLLESKGYSPNDRECSFYVESIMNLEYKTLLDIADDNLKLGNSVVIDAPFISYFSNINYIEELKKTYDWKDVTPIVIQVSVDFAVLKNRMIDRSLDRDTWKLDNWDIYIKSVQEKQCLWKSINIFKIDNSYLSIATQDINNLFHHLK
jgi:predicted kinase